MNGKAELDELGDLLGTELPEGEWSTVGGLIFSTLGHVPTVGETLDTHGHRFLLKAMDGRRIARVLVSKLEPEADTPAPKAGGSEGTDVLSDSPVNK